MARLAHQMELAAKKSAERLAKHIKCRQVDSDCEGQAKLGEIIGSAQSTAGRYLKDPDTMSLGTLRKINMTLHLDPVLMLYALGYTTSDINKLKKENHQ